MGLTLDQVAILREMACERAFGRAGDGKEEGWACANWIAERCGHYYDTPWYGSKLPSLLKKNLIERGGRGWYRITDAGRAALAAIDGEK